MNLRSASRFTPSSDGIAHIAALPRRTFSDQAAHKFASHFEAQFGHTVEVSNHQTIAQVWDMQNVGSAFLLPLQNSGSGLVKEHWRYLKAIYRDPTIKIVADINLAVHMYLCGVSGIDPAQATGVISHFQGIRQCSRLVGKSDIAKDRREAPVLFPGTLSNIAMHECSDSTDQGLQTVSQRQDPHLLGLGSRESADDYGLSIYRSEAADLPPDRNITQMLLLQRTHDGENFSPQLPYHGVFFVLKNQRGALRDLLAPIADCGANVTALHKRTMRPHQREVEFFMELDATSANEIRKLPSLIRDIPHVKKSPSWSS